MNAITIFTHSLRQVLGNFGMAVRASGGVWLSLFGVGLVLATALMTSGSQLLAIGFPLAFLVMLVWGVSLIAVVWHRYILLEEPPKGFIPARNGLNIWPYFGLGVGITLIVAMALLVLYFAVTVVVDPDWIYAAYNPNAPSMLPAHIALRWTVSLLVTIITLRFALVLPAIALDKRVAMGQSWQQTKPFFGAIIGLSVILSLFNAVVMLVYAGALSAVAGSNGASFLVTVLGLGFQWFYFMLNISVLSTLYGHIIEKREVY